MKILKGNFGECRLKDLYYVKSLPKKTAEYFILTFHYLHRKCQIMYSYGLFEKISQRCVGCITFGLPASPDMLRLCGEEEIKHALELNRLWVEDSTPKNTETFFISRALKFLPIEIIISYADPNIGHYGCIYQASNFLYTGRGASTNRIFINEKEKHSRHLNDSFSKKYKNITKVKEKGKHRYVYFNAIKPRKKELLKKLKWKILPYPKPEKIKKKKKIHIKTLESFQIPSNKPC